MPAPLTASQLAEALHVTVATVSTWARQRRIPYSQIGKARFFVLEDVLAATRQPARTVVHLGRGRKQREEDQFASLRDWLGRGTAVQVRGKRARVDSGQK